MLRLIILLTSTAVLAACASTSLNSGQAGTIVSTPMQVDALSGLMQAVASGDEEQLREALLSGDSVNASYKGQTPLRVALSKENSRFALLLMRAGAQPDWDLLPGAESTLMLASRGGLNKVVKELIRRGVDLAYIDQRGHSALSQAALGGHLTTVNILINAGSDVNVEPEGRTLLMHMVQENNMLIAKPLIEAGADLNRVSGDGQTALGIARKNQFHELDLLLVQAGARL